MKKAVIETGGKQYIVAAGDELEIELVDDSRLEFSPLLVWEGKDIEVGRPTLTSIKVRAEVIEPKVAGAKIKVLKYKAKKRYRKLTGHRQKYTRIKLIAIGKTAKKTSVAKTAKKVTPAKAKK